MSLTISSDPRRAGAELFAWQHMQLGHRYVLLHAPDRSDQPISIHCSCGDDWSWPEILRQRAAAATLRLAQATAIAGLLEWIERREAGELAADDDLWLAAEALRTAMADADPAVR